jgi:DNA helicase-4
MRKVGDLLIVIFLIITGIWFYRRYKEKERIRKELEEKLVKEEEERRKKLYSFFKAIIEKVKEANINFENCLLFENGYFSNFALRAWVNTSKLIYKKMEGKSPNDINLLKEEVDAIDTFRKYFDNCHALREDYNERFLKEELIIYNDFFNNIEGRNLDLQQRTAIINDEDNNLIIAGAGSGKTTTLVGKVNYIIDRYNVNPEEILLISFTRKSATALKERIKIEEAEVNTFHKFGKDVILESEKKKPNIFEEDQFTPLIRKYFNQQVKKEEYISKITQYFIDYMKPAKSQFEFESQGDYIQYLKDKNFRSYKLIPIKGRDLRTTFNLEVVKSIEECKIANFLLFNGIEYKYEFPYEHETATEEFCQYKPDFTIFQDDRKIYIEHFGISRNGDVPSWFTGENGKSAREKYHLGMDWKRQIHEDNNTILIETYSYEMSEGELFSNLTQKLIQNGITLTPKGPQEIWEILQTAAKEEVNSLLTLFQTFINLMKSNNLDIQDIEDRNKQVYTGFIKERNNLFLDIIKPIYENYQRYLVERGEIDFNDMINKATEYIKNGRYSRRISYILIDEFQDISIGRYNLIKAIKDKNPSCKMFCVGDDWQSIYRFTGSDLALFKDFEKYFGYTSKSKLETTYRFHEPLISVSSDFILKNPNQSIKELKGTTANKNTSYRIEYSFSENFDDTEALNSVLQGLITIENIEQKEIMILGRYSFDFERIKNDSNTFIINQDDPSISFKYTDDKDEDHIINMPFLTVHKAKGLEADIVILLNCNSGKFGFPAEMTDDEVLNLLLSEADQFENGEERRLFYVAMSRARERIYFITDHLYKSKFINELEIDCDQTSNRKCPRCHSADLILRRTGVAKNGCNYKFYGCSNYLYGCDYSKTEFESSSMLDQILNDLE